MPPAKPLPVTKPMRPHISCTAAMKGKEKGAVQSCWRPKAAPVCAYVPMPEGSSSEAPVMNPGPKLLSIRLSFFMF